MVPSWFMVRRVPPVISMSILFFISQNLWTEWVEEVFIINQTS
jgi:hypothetical protein